MGRALDDLKRKLRAKPISMPPSGRFKKIGPILRDGIKKEKFLLNSYFLEYGKHGETGNKVCDILLAISINNLQGLDLIREVHKVCKEMEFLKFRYLANELAWFYCSMKFVSWRCWGIMPRCVEEVELEFMAARHADHLLALGIGRSAARACFSAIPAYAYGRLRKKEKRS